MGFCANCGTELKAEARFCPQCGHQNRAVSGSTSSVPVQESKKTSIIDKVANIVDVTGGAKEVTKKDVEKELKCPSCGAPIDAFTAVCPDCGYRITKVDCSKYINDLMNGIKNAEKDRKTGADVFTSQFLCDKTDKKVKKFVKEYPIADTPEDLLEFMFTAVNFIDFQAIKSFRNILYTLYMPFGPQSLTVRTNIIWYKKFKASYIKAKTNFSDSSIFKEIEKLYDKISVRIPKIIR